MICFKINKIILCLAFEIVDNHQQHLASKDKQLSLPETSANQVNSLEIPKEAEIHGHSASVFRSKGKRS